jgi:hypothetical protein
MLIIGARAGESLLFITDVSAGESMFIITINRAIDPMLCIFDVNAKESRLIITVVRLVYNVCQG